MIADLGSVIDIEGDTFKTTTNKSGTVPFISVKGDQSNFFLLVSRDGASVGEYTFIINVEEKLIGQVRKTNISVNVKLIDSSKSSEDDTEDKENTENSSGSSATSSTEYTITNTFDVAFYFTPKTKFERPKSTDEDELFNDLIKKPFVTKVSSEGVLSMNLDNKRFKEAGSNSEDARMRRQLQEASAKNETAVSVDFQIIKGKPSNDSIAVEGISMYMEATEMTAVDQLQFTYTIGGFSGTSLDLKLNFDSPGSITSTTEKDYLVIEMRNFRDKEGNLIAEDNDIRNALPNQISGEVALVAATAGAAAASSVGASSTINIVLNIIMSTSMN